MNLPESLTPSPEEAQQEISHYQEPTPLQSSVWPSLNVIKVAEQPSFCFTLGFANGDGLPLEISEMATLPTIPTIN